MNKATERKAYTLLGVLTGLSHMWSLVYNEYKSDNEKEVRKRLNEIGIELEEYEKTMVKLREILTKVPL